VKTVKFSIIILTTILFVFGFLSCERETPEGKGFAIYLLAHDISAAEVTAINTFPVIDNLELNDEPAISQEEIVGYSEMTHEIELTAQAYENLTELDIPTSGKVFIACVDHQPVYWGAFWVPYSSQSFGGVIILIPPLLEQENTIQIKLGYPSLSFFKAKDPRNDPRIMQSLQKAGKLR
jgi:hypothetical protein